MSLKYSDASHRYWLDGKPVRGVTSLIDGGLPKPALIKWAPKFVAQVVEEWRTGHWDESRDQLHKDLADAIREDRFPEWLARTPDKYKEAKGATGTEVHHLGERAAHGEDVDVPDRLLPYVNGYIEWLDSWGVEPIITEQSVGNRTHWYAGRIDMIAKIARLGDEIVGVDLKTSNHVYSSTALQVAAYCRAEFTVTDDRPEKELCLPPVDRTIVVHITPEGTRHYDLGKDPAEIDEAFADFLRVKAVADRIGRIDGKWNAKARKALGGYLSDPIELLEVSA